MKGIILAGGNATRLRPLTIVTSKQLLPVYNKPMIFYPLNTLIRAGIKEILIIVAPEYSGHFLKLIGSSKEFLSDVTITYEVQDEPRGLADAFILGKKFIGKDNIAMILGDNIFIDDLSSDIISFKSGARVFAKEVTDPGRFGVVEFDKHYNAKSIEEKPVKPKSNYVITGLYIYDSKVVDIAKNLKPSERGEIEITDINNAYLESNALDVKIIKKPWFDAGTFDSLLDASNYISKID